MLVTKSY